MNGQKTMQALYVFLIFESTFKITCGNLKKYGFQLNYDNKGAYCAAFNRDTDAMARLSKTSAAQSSKTRFISVKTVTTKPRPTIDPVQQIDKVVHDFMYGNVKPDGIEGQDVDLTTERQEIIDQDPILHYPSGNIMHAELYRNKSAVHLPRANLIHLGHCRLRVTDDLMQTALNAFAIILIGSLDDLKALPPEYVLHSARAISMMKLPKEKLAVMWDVVLAGRKPHEIDIETLEKFRPLFKYLNGKQIARLNLSDNRILLYIGTHPDMKRHQMGVVASKYIKMNKEWSTAKYLNIMNNVLCGVPMTYMRKVPENTFLQLSHQVFYHVRACDPLQKRFYLSMMTRTQALGRSFSWSARDVSRLGLLLAEVDGRWLASINPEAMAGITAQVMNEMPPQNLEYITEVQLRHLKQKPLNIMAKKLKAYRRKMDSSSGGIRSYTYVNIMLPVPIFFTTAVK